METGDSFFWSRLLGSDPELLPGMHQNNMHKFAPTRRQKWHKLAPDVVILHPFTVHAVPKIVLRHIASAIKIQRVQRGGGQDAGANVTAVKNVYRDQKKVKTNTMNRVLALTKMPD